MSYNTPSGFLQGGTAFTLNPAGSVVPARMAWGTVVLASGVGTLGVGFPVALAVTTAYGAAIGAGTVASAQVDPSLFASGSVIVRGLLGTTAAAAAGVVSVLAFGG